VKHERWVPMRWPGGPLEMEERRREDAPAEEIEALQWWAAPTALEVLEGAPVNCLVVTWAGGTDGDAAYQRSLAPLVAAARQRGLSLVGWVAAEADLRRAAASAESAGLEALATESAEPLDGFEVLRFGELGGGRRSGSGFFGIAGAPWPGMQLRGFPFGGDADASTGPTGPPWIDSNAWRVRVARTLLGARTVWLAFEPPEESRWPLRGASYVQAIADAAVHGGRWMISLDPRLRGGLARKEDAARSMWSEIGRSLAFFGEHPAWSGYRPVGHLGVVSSFSGDDEFLSLEVLNLLSRQSSLYRIVQKSRALDEPFDGLKAVLFVDETPPGPDLVRKLYAFAEEGGTLITPPGWEERGTLIEHAWPPRFRVFRCGEGRLAVAREEISDPYVLADDAQLLMSHRYDGVRLFNAGATMSHYCVGEDGASGVLHLVSFMNLFSGVPLTVWFRREWASARLWLPGSEEARPAERRPAEPGVEFSLESVPVYGALEVST
jgi:hypothetical protein